MPKKFERRTGPSKRSQKSGGHLFAKLVSAGRRAFIRRQRCIATGAKTGEWVLAQPWMPETLRQLCPYKARVVVAHVDGRGAGNPDAGNMVPLEWQVHDLVGRKTWAWLEKAARLMPAEEIAAEFERKFVARAAAMVKNAERRGVAP